MKYASELEQIDFIETGTFLDSLLGGIPRGRIGEIFGDEGIGKTTLALQIVARVQRDGLKVVWVDFEHSLEPNHAKNMGVDLSKLALIEDEIAEDSLNELEEEAVRGGFDLIIVDSIGAMRTRGQAEKEYGEKSIGAQANLVSNFARNMATYARYKNFALIGINHSFIDIMAYGAPKRTSGGKKWQYYKSWSVELKPSGKWLKKGEEFVGKVITAEVKKDKVRGQEKVKMDAHLLFKEGFSTTSNILDEAIRKEVITRSGNSYFFEGEKIGTISKLREWSKENTELIKSKL